MASDSTCPTCGASNPARAKFCAECGSKLAARDAAPAARGGDPVLKWFIAGSVVLALHGAAIILAVRRSGTAESSSLAGAPFAGGGAPSDPSRGTTDLSSLSPREAADRLYDRIARADEAGDTAQVSFFGPMAIQAYASVSPLDADARLHLGLIEIALGNFAGAAAQADSIGRESRTHLFAPLLRARAAQKRGDSAAARAALRAFLQGYDAERARQLPEYEDHRTMLDQVREEARRAGGAP